MKAIIARLSPIVFLMLCQCTSGIGGTTTGNPMTEDDSTSGTAAGAIGGAISASSGSSSLAMNFLRHLPLVHGPAGLFLLLPQALAGDSCPTYKTASGDGCTASGETMWLEYGGCEFGTSSTVWTGVQALIVSSGSPSCGTFPSPGSNGSLYRQYVTAVSSATPSEIQSVSKFGTVAEIDDASANLKNFDSDTISDIVNGGYGDAVAFSGGARVSVAVGHRIFTDTYDHSVTTLSTPVTLTTINSTSRYINGSVTVYHNILQIVATATFNNVVHDDECCLPVSGTITTTFAAGADPSFPPTRVGSLMVGGTETLELTGCGTGTLTAYDGQVMSVALTRCF